MQAARRESQVREIDGALRSGSWEGAERVWEHIESRRRQLVAELSPAQSEALDLFIANKRYEGVHILRRGPLERYLPQGHGGKDLEKLIAFLADGPLENRLPPDVLGELRLIADSVLAWPTQGNVARAG